MSTIIKRLHSYFIHEIWEIDLNTLGKFKVLLIKSLRLLYVAIREFTEGQITLRAMSLVYTTILSTVPLIAVSFSVLKAFGVHNQVEPFLNNFLAPLGPKGEEITARIIEFVDNIKAGILGSIGLVLLLYTVISLIQKIEDAFNHIWKIKKARSFMQRFSDYMSIILIGPILIFSALGITASIKSTTIVQKLLSIEPFGSAFLIAGKILPYVFVCFAFTFIYVFIPNTKVRFRSALVGGVFAGVIWETTGYAFTAFVITSTKYTAIYSGLAIAIFFMLWLYLSWLILLVGGEISFYFQYPQFLSVKKEQFLLSNRLKERLAFLILVLIGYNFYKSKDRWTLDSLVERLNLPVEPVQDVLILLEKKKLVIESFDDPPQFMPAKDLDTVKLKDFYHLIRGAEEETFSIEEKYLSAPEVDTFVKKVVDAIDSSLGEQTIKDVVLLHKEED